MLHLGPNIGPYRYEIRQKRKRLVGPIDTDSPMVTLTSPELTRALIDIKDDSNNLLEVRVKSKRLHGWTKDAIFWLHYDQAAERFTVVGIEHPS